MKFIYYFIIAYIIYAGLCLYTYRQSIHLWDWVCHNWFPYHEHLNDAEITYIESCQTYLLLEYLLRPFLICFQPYLPYLSNFTYAFEWNETEKEIHRGRLGYGLASGFGTHQIIEKAALLVLESHDLQNIPKVEGVFYGLAWNFHDNTMRYYYKMPITQLEKPNDVKTYQIGLKAWTWNLETKEMIDEKDYVFVQNKNEALMFSKKRNQWILQNNNIPKDIPPKVLPEINIWKEHGYNLDTVSHWDSDWVFYFPRIHLWK